MVAVLSSGIDLKGAGREIVTPGFTTATQVIEPLEPRATALTDCYRRGEDLFDYRGCYVEATLSQQMMSGSVARSAAQLPTVRLLRSDRTLSRRVLDASIHGD